MGVEVVEEVQRKASVIWVIFVQIWPLIWKVFAKCKLGAAVLREVCGNKLLMCFLFVAGRSYQDAWHKLFGLFRNLATFNPLPVVSPILSLSLGHASCLYISISNCIPLSYFCFLAPTR